MNIKKENNELVLRIPLRQKVYNLYMGDEPVGETDNLIGIVAKDEHTISYLIDMDYKGKGPQEGMPIIFFNTEEDLEEVCKEFGIDVWEMPLCAYCGEAIRGTHTYGSKGEKCYECK